MDDLADLARRISAIERDLWAGPPVKNGLPRVPQLAALPTAGANFEGRLVYIPASAGVAGKVYICRLESDGATWEWSELDNVAAVDLSAIPFMVGAASGLLSAEYVSGTSPSVGYPSVILRYSNANEVTTVSTSAVDLLTSSAISIPVTSGIIIEGVCRKSAGAAAFASIGLKLNSTTVIEAVANGANNQNLWASFNSNAAEDGQFHCYIGPRSANYNHAISNQNVSNINGAAQLATTSLTAAVPSASITAIALRAISGSGSVTLAVKEVAVYEVLYQ